MRQKIRLILISFFIFQACTSTAATWQKVEGGSSGGSSGGMSVGGYYKKDFYGYCMTPNKIKGNCTCPTGFAALRIDQTGASNEPDSTYMCVKYD